MIIIIKKSKYFIINTKDLVTKIDPKNREASIEPVLGLPSISHLSIVTGAHLVMSPPSNSNGGGKLPKSFKWS